MPLTTGVHDLDNVATIPVVLWVVQKYIGHWIAWGEKIPKTCHEFVGVFLTEESAIAHCLDERHWIAPINIEQAFSDETVMWPGAYYPKPC